MTSEIRIKLRPDIRIAKPDENLVILVGESRRHALRLSGTSSRLIDLLIVGCSRRELCDHLQSLGYPEGDIEAEIDPFLVRLASARVLLTDSDTYNLEGDKALAFPMLNIDPLARFLAEPFLSMPRWLTVSVGCLAMMASLAFIILSAIKGRLLPTVKDIYPGALWGQLGIIPWIFLHELSHAIASRAVKCPVSGLGMRCRKWGLFFFVDTRYLVLLSSRWAKAWVALAGPFMDIILLGLTSLGILLCGTDSMVLSALRLLFITLTVYSFWNLNPWRVSDGSNTISALLNDPFLLVNSMSFKADRKKSPTYFYYRLCAGIYLLVCLMAIGYCAHLAYSGIKEMFH